MLLLLLLLVAPEFEAETGNEIVIEELQRLRREPIRINVAGQQEFARILWISTELAGSIVRTREEIGGFKKIEDLVRVPGMSDEILDRIRPYITFMALAKKAPKPSFQFETRTRVQESFPSEQGSKLGHPRKTYQRGKLKYGRIDAVVLLEKDQYELDYWDHATGGIMARLNDRLPTIVFGDYKLDFAEGLICGFPPHVTFKSQGLIKGKGKGIKLYSNSGENTFLRGVGAELKLTERIRNFVFLSDVKLDGKKEDEEVTIYHSYEGDHSTESGLSKKDRIRERLIGTRLEYRHGVKLGSTWYRNFYSLNPEGTETGTHTLAGFDLSGSFGHVEYCGEIGRCDETWAGVAGIEYGEKKLRFGTLYRHYPPGFFLLHSAPWSDRTSSTGSGGVAEKGNYLYAGYKISKATRLSCHFDAVTRLPRLQSGELLTHGVEYCGEIEHRITKSLSLTCRCSAESMEENSNKKFRLQSDAKLKSVRMRVRAEKVYETDGSESRSGALFYGDVGLRFLKDLTLNTRLVLFDSDLSKSRLCEYELDLPGVMRNQFLSKQGTRFYVLLGHWITSFLRIGAKYEVTSKIDASPTEKYSLQLDLER
jgi:competence ComEA-like helix-hairpin-helix protein